MIPLPVPGAYLDPQPHGPGHHAVWIYDSGVPGHGVSRQVGRVWRVGDKWVHRMPQWTTDLHESIEAAAADLAARERGEQP